MILRKICALVVVILSFQVTAVEAQTAIEIIDATGDGVGNTLDTPKSIAVDGSGNVYVPGARTHNAFKITPAGVIIEIIDATGDGGGNTLSNPADIAVDGSGNVYVTGAGSGAGPQNAFKITPAGVVTQIIDAMGDGGGNTLSNPADIAVDGSGNVYVIGRASSNAFQISPAGVITEIIDATGDGGGNVLNVAAGIAVDGSGNVYVTGEVSSNAFKITPGGVIIEIIDNTGDGGGNTLNASGQSIAVDIYGNVYVAGLLSHNAFKITPAGVITEIIDATGDGGGNTLSGPDGITVDNSGNVYLSAQLSDNAFKISTRPAITSAAYDTSSGSLVVSGINFEGKTGTPNDITSALLTFTGEGGVSYKLTNTSDVEIDNSTTFTLSLSAIDKFNVDNLLNKNGASSADNTTYNLATDDDFVANFIDGDTSDSTGNTITVSGVFVSDSDGNLIAASGVTEPVALNWSDDTVGEAVDIFDFALTDGGTADGLPMDVSAVVLNVTGNASDADRAKITWRLNGPDASNVTGVYSPGADTITFSALSISIADGDTIGEVYTVNGFYNDNTGLSNGNTMILSVDGDTDLTIGSSGTQMGTTSAVNNSTGTISSDNIGPVVTSVGVPTNSTYALASDLDFTVNFNENVTVDTGGGTPRLTLTVDASSRFASYLSGTGTPALVFRYTVPAGDQDLDGITLAANLDPNSGALRDAQNNDAATTLNSVGSLTLVLVDAVAPTVSEVTPVVTPGSDGTPDVTFSTTEAGTLAVGGSCGSSDEGAVGSGSQTITLTQVDNSTLLTSGTYSDCTVTVTDGAANASNVLALTAFDVDVSSPTVDTNAGLSVDEGDLGEILSAAALASSDNVSAAAAVTYTLASVPGNGTLRSGGTALLISSTFTQADIAANAVTYDHDGSETLTDTFAFSLMDGLGNVNDNGAANFTFNITVAAVNDAPTTVADADATNEDNAVMIDVLANDSDDDGTLVTGSVTVTSAPSNGGTSVNTGTGVITYTPNADFEGLDNFSYTVEDNSGLASAATVVTVTVNAQNDAPVAVNDNANTQVDTAVSISVAANDTDIDAADAPDPTTIVVVGAASNGLAVFNGGSNQVDYTPNGGFSGIDSFTYTIDDGTGATSNVATVSISVANPVAADRPQLTGLASSLTVGETDTGSISGGTAPYSASSNSPLVLEVSVSGDTLSATGLSEGMAFITVSDSTGASTSKLVAVVAVTNDSLPELESAGADGSTTSAVFRGGVSADDGASYFSAGAFSVGESIEIKTEIEPEPAHVEEQVDIIVAVIDPSNPGVILLLGEDGSITVYDGVNLIAFSTVNLSAIQTVDITRGQQLLLDSTSVGHYEIYVGYLLLSTGELFYNSTPIELEVFE